MSYIGISFSENKVFFIVSVSDENVLSETFNSIYSKVWNSYFHLQKMHWERSFLSENLNDFKNTSSTCFEKRRKSACFRSMLFKFDIDENLSVEMSLSKFSE